MKAKSYSKVTFAMLHNFPLEKKIVFWALPVEKDLGAIFPELQLLFEKVRSH